MPDPMPDPTTTPGRRTFGPVLLVGLGSAALGAVACAKPWVEQGARSQDAAPGYSLYGGDVGRMQLAAALSLVVLAVWGVLLVTRGRVRRLLALVGVVAALGVAVTVVVGHRTLPNDVRDAFHGSGLSNAQLDVHVTGWFWVAALTTLMSLLAMALAVRFAPQWPAMGTKYDAPGARAAAPRDETDMWRALDEGADPTRGRDSLE